MAEVSVNGKTAHYTTGGKPWEAGLPLALFVHGAGGNQSLWVLQTRAVAHHGWNVAAVDLPGHGRSQDQPDLDSIEAYARWVCDFLDALGVEKAVVVGHSMGAVIATTLAATYPDRVAGIVLVGSQETMPVNDQLLRASGEDIPLASAIITFFGFHDRFQIGGAPNPGTWTHGAARAMMEQCPPAVFHRDFEACNRWQGRPFAEKVRCPTLVVSGLGDRMTPARNGRILAGLIPGAVYQELPDGGHFLPVEAPRIFLGILQDFLKTIEY